MRKCGYEKPCILRAGEAYQFWTYTKNKNYNHGTIQTDTWGTDRSFVEYEPQYFMDEDFIDVTLKPVDKEEPIFSGAISLYDRLNVDAA